MSEIPEDIAKVANELAATANTCCYRSDGYEEEMADLIARAILAERERCAKIAESGHWKADTPPGMLAPPNGSPAVWVGLDGPAIAAAIRGDANG